MDVDLDFIIRELPRYTNAAHSLKESLLANLVMMGEIPSPTYSEAERNAMLLQRFTDIGLDDINTDGAGNVHGTLPGANTESNILVLAHSDCVFAQDTDHTISIEEQTISGPGVGDNSIGLAALASLPALLDALNISLQSNIILLGVTRGLGRADLEGIRYYLNHTAPPIRGAVCIEGVQLGRLSINSIGMLRGEINCRVPEEYDWSRFGTGGAIFELNDIINRMVEIRLPKRPRTSIIMGAIKGGNSFSSVATDASLRFEIRSDSDFIVDEIHTQIKDNVNEVMSATSADISLDVLARRSPGGLSSSHPLPRATRAIMDTLEVPTRLAPSTSELSALIDAGIPGVTLGLTRGEHSLRADETVEIEPIFTGLAQLVGTIQAIDGGCCDADPGLD